MWLCDPCRCALCVLVPRPPSHTTPTVGRSVAHRMRGYSAGDIARVLRLSVGGDISRAESLFGRFDVNSDGKIVEYEFKRLIKFMLGDEGTLTSAQLENVYEMMAGSRETVSQSEFIDFFCSPSLTEESSIFSMVSRSTVTAVGISADQQAVVFGGADCVAKLYDLRDSSRILYRKCKKQVVAVVISSNGDRVGICCQGGHAQWVRVATDELVFEWEFQHEVFCLALDASDSILAMGGADSSVRLYSLDDGSQIYRFHAEAPVRSICMAEGDSYFLELEDGHNTGQLSDVELPEKMSLESKCPYYSPVTVRGTVMYRSGKVDRSEWTALHKVLQSTRWILIMSALVIASGSLTVLSLPQVDLISDDFPVFQKFLSLAFAFEFGLRALSHHFSEGNTSIFVLAPLNALDFCIIGMEVIIATANVSNSGGSQNGNLQTVARLAKTARAARLLRIWRLVDKVSHMNELDVVINHDIRLPDGTVLKNVSNGRLASVGTKLKLGHHHKYGNSNATPGYETAIQNTPQSSRQLSRKLSRAARKLSICGGINIPQPPSRQSTVQYGEERREALKFIDIEYDEGTPVDVQVLARVKMEEKTQLVAVGCEDHRARTWQFGISIEQVLHGNLRKLSLVESGEGGAVKNSRATQMVQQEISSRMYHVQHFTHIVNRQVSLNKYHSADAAVLLYYCQMLSFFVIWIKI